jgi:hypothetical protein
MDLRLRPEGKESGLEKMPSKCSGELPHGNGEPTLLEVRFVICCSGRPVLGREMLMSLSMDVQGMI